MISVISTRKRLLQFGERGCRVQSKNRTRATSMATVIFSLRVHVAFNSTIVAEMYDNVRDTVQITIRAEIATYSNLSVLIFVLL